MAAILLNLGTSPRTVANHALGNFTSFHTPTPDTHTLLNWYTTRAMRRCGILVSLYWIISLLDILLDPRIHTARDTVYIHIHRNLGPCFFASIRMASGTFPNVVIASVGARLHEYSDLQSSVRHKMSTITPWQAVSAELLGCTMRCDQMVTLFGDLFALGCHELDH